jgi:hypothetical protein
VETDAIRSSPEELGISAKRLFGGQREFDKLVGNRFRGGHRRCNQFPIPLDQTPPSEAQNDDRNFPFRQVVLIGKGFGLA